MPGDPRYAGPPSTWPGVGDASPFPMMLPGGVRYPGVGLPQRRGEDREALSAFARLAFGGTLGQRSILRYDSSKAFEQPSPVNILTLQGDDLDAQRLVITLGAPQVSRQEFSGLQDVADQNIQITQDNFEMPASDFPGTASPIIWPPFEAIIEWGCGGANFLAYVDFVNGMALGVTASFVRVHGAVAIGSGISGTSAAYGLTAFVGPGWIPGRAQKTVYVGVVDTLSPSNVFPIPPFAKTAYVIGCDNTVVPPNITTGDLQFWQSPDGSATNKNVGNFFIDGNQPVAFPIPPGAEYFSVYNGMGVNALFSVVFEIQT